MSYKIKLELFEGPLDLLLYLVKKDHLNIYDIPIARVTEQYLQYINLMQLLDLNIAGEFLVMAATLMQIKSKMLLPAEEGQEESGDQEDPREELVKRLLEYEKFKEIAENLRQKESDQREVYKRPKVEIDTKEEKGKDVYFEASIFDLINAFSKALKDVPKEVFYEVVKDQFTVEQATHEILHLLLVRSQVKLSELFSKAKNKMDIIVTFLAVLELIRVKEIIARQNQLFEDIEILRNKENIIPYERRDERSTD
ncbi:MAG: segregation/condensation protein A [Candidatus Omnitrophica bacterium]|jgi:segregation and condensation protein A|nr:segregation/condensation protein A [Candidatus Omnitrophota bacterium]MDD3987436.1 segregation/condensation protein A [Candidatus Omnitrophota bacterium]MDD5664574.1 segregation/condensation protein A [Candidatus Omnitrophota bacterium]